MAIYEDKELISQQEYNLAVIEVDEEGDLAFTELWRPSPSQPEMVWWVSTHWAYVFSKRVFDFIVAVLMLVVLTPLIAVVALLIKLETEGPVFFRQLRVGKWGRTFSCIKFRSMHTDAEARKQALLALNEVDGPVFKIKADPRTTRVGRIIRKLSIDEVPQLINVLKGEMSMVGPRPPLPSEMVKYEYHQLRRLDVKPGITGLQQVSGRSDLSFQEWIALDIEYVERRSFWFDLWILVRTIPAVISTRGAY